MFPEEDTGAGVISTQLNKLWAIATGTRFVRNILSNYLGFVVHAVIALTLTPFLIHRLGAEQFGVWVLLNTLLGHFELLEIGLLPAIVRYVSLYEARDDQKEIESLVGSAAAALLLVGVATLPIVWISTRLGPALLNFTGVDQVFFTKAMWLIGLAAFVAYFRRLLFAVMEGVETSLDSRYFGPLDRRLVLGTAEPLWLRTNSAFFFNSRECSPSRN